MSPNPVSLKLTCLLYPSLGGAVLEDGDGTDLAQVYNPKTCTWTEVAPMQIARSGSAACTLKGKIYVIGELDSKQVFPNSIIAVQLAAIVLGNRPQIFD